MQGGTAAGGVGGVGTEIVGRGGIGRMDAETETETLVGAEGKVGKGRSEIEGERGRLGRAVISVMREKATVIKVEGCMVCVVFDGGLRWFI